MADEDEGDGANSSSDTPDGVKGALGSWKSHTPSGRRDAMRMFAPGVCTINHNGMVRETLESKEKANSPNRGPSPPGEPNGVMRAAGC